MAEYIEREAVWNELERLDNYIPDSERSRTLDDVAFAVDSIPAADVRPERHGYWEKDKEGIFQCSECKRLAVPTQYSQHLGNYCPNCGAKMDGKEPENE